MLEDMDDRVLNVGIVTYSSLHCNFTNYGTVLQAWALKQAVAKAELEGAKAVPWLVDYCPDSMRDKSPLDPIRNMWDTDRESRKMCELSMPAIRENFEKIEDFYHRRLNLTAHTYNIDNFGQLPLTEGINRFICGSDSIYDIDEFGMDRVFFSDIEPMRKHSIAYAPSFQDSFGKFDQESLNKVKCYMDNYLAVGLRDRAVADYLDGSCDMPVVHVCDPTLLLDPADYQVIMAERLEESPYLLYYSRRYNPKMERFAERLAEEKNLKVIEISLRAANAVRHRAFYSAGVEEFLSLVRYADCVVTNSYHCMIFSMLFEREFYVFSREHCHNKICELLEEFGLQERFCSRQGESCSTAIDYGKVNALRTDKQAQSAKFLKHGLELLCSAEGDRNK